MYCIFSTTFLLLLVSITADAYIDNENNKKYIEQSLISNRRSHLRIIAGIKDTSNKYPFVVRIGMKVQERPLPESIKKTLYPEYLHYCSASLISEQWVLTAGHCIATRKPTLIRYGNMTVAPNDTLATYSDVLKVIPHPSYLHYEGILMRNDIGLLLVTKVQLSLYGRILAVDFKTLIGLPVVYAGFGKANVSDETRLILQRKQREYGNAVVKPCPKYIYSHPMLCLASQCSNKAQQAFYGDSGGPLLHAGRIVGVCHGGDTDYYPAKVMTVMYTAASPFLGWIFTMLSKFNT